MNAVERKGWQGSQKRGDWVRLRLVWKLLECERMLGDVRDVRVRVRMLGMLGEIVLNEVL